MNKKLTVEVIENKNHHFQPYPRVHSLDSIAETSSFDSSQIKNFESTVAEMNSVFTGDVSELLKTIPYFNPNDNLPLFIANVESVISTLQQFTLNTFSRRVNETRPF